MGSKVLMSLLITIVFTNVMQILSTYDNSVVHLGRLDSTSKNATSDGNIAGEWALFVNVCAVDSFRRGFEA